MLQNMRYADAEHFFAGEALMSETPLDAANAAFWTAPLSPQYYLAIVNLMERALLLGGADFRDALEMPVEHFRVAMTAMRDAAERAPSQPGVLLPIPIDFDGVRIGMRWQFFPRVDANLSATELAHPIAPPSRDDASAKSPSPGVRVREAIADYLMSRWSATAGTQFLKELDAED
jgi:hypothetical protein